MRLADHLKQVEEVALLCLVVVVEGLFISGLSALSSLCTPPLVLFVLETFND